MTQARWFALRIRRGMVASMRQLAWTAIVSAASVMGAACGDEKPAGGVDALPGDAPDVCPLQCSGDGRSVLDCKGNVTSVCTTQQTCAQNACVDACSAALLTKRSIGCDYYATDMDTSEPGYCFAMFVANTWNMPAKIQVEYQGQALDVARFTRLPTGSGAALTYAPYDATTGLAPNEVAVLFLSGAMGAAPDCPVEPAVAAATQSGTRIGDAFHVTTDGPVVAYQINPFGGGSASITGASLLIPTSAWAHEYVLVNAAPQTVGAAASPSLNIIASEDSTVATVTPVAPVSAGSGIPAAPAGQPLAIALARGQHAQLTQMAELTGSVVTSNKPIGVMAGHQCMNVPEGTAFCDHAEQMVPPVTALGHRYAAVMYRSRRPAETSTYWRLVGAVDGTTLTYSTNVGGPTTLNRGQSVTFETGTPFLVNSQDASHPFMLFAYMSSSLKYQNGYGDPDFVLVTPPAQYLKQYVFFTDPTYPETNLVIVRTRGATGQFADVVLDCAGTLSGWSSIDADHEYTRVDLTTGDFQNVGTCSTGRREIHSDEPFGLWVWGWGTAQTFEFTANVSYGYPGGMNVQPINSVIL